MHPLDFPFKSVHHKQRSLRHFRAVLFDMDGVVTDTANVHAAAWKALFDEAMAVLDPKQPPFDAADDYRLYVDGRPREAGVRSFMESRGLVIPEGSDEDPAGAMTVHGLASQKQMYFEQALSQQGVLLVEPTIELIRQLRAEYVPLALVTSSRNGPQVLEAGGVLDLFDVIVDGNTALQLHLPGKPDPATYLEASRLLGVDPADSVVIEDAASGVQAGRDGGYAWVVGLNRHAGQSDELLKNAGADVVVDSLDKLDLVNRTTRPFDPAWVLRYDDYDPTTEGTREALCTLANGYWGTRGVIPGSTANLVHYPGTYLAGLFNRLTSAVEGRDVEVEHMVNLPDWTYLSVTPEDGEQLHPEHTPLVDYRQDLDLRRGLLTRRMLFEDERGRRTRLVTRQMQCLAGQHLAAIEFSITAENWSGLAKVETLINGQVANRNVAADRSLAGNHLDPVQVKELDGESVLLETMTNTSKIRVAMATRTRFMEPAKAPEPVRSTLSGDPMVAGQTFDITLNEGETVILEKTVAVANSTDHAIFNPADDAGKRVLRANNFRNLLTYHEEMWTLLWSRFAVVMDREPTTDHRAQLALNLHTFHVLQTVFAAERGMGFGVPARGLHGEGYRGHLFWDEMYIYPMLTLRRPEYTRDLLKYRYHRLAAARHAAFKAGYRGAMFPWQSGSSGREETPTELFNPINQQWMPDNSHRQRHVSLAIAYSVLRYFEATDDVTFMADYGAEMLVEICRFFVSLTQFMEESGRYEIHGVMGPDEYHDGYPDTPGSGLRNNAYTNVLLSWVLQKTTEVLDRLTGLDDPISEWLDVFDEETADWKRISKNLKVPFMNVCPEGFESEACKIIAQFDGYEDLLELDWEHYRKVYGNIGRLDLILQSEGDATNRYKLSKQADVLMLFYLFSKDELQQILDDLGYGFNQSQFSTTVDYYLARTSHGSTLSRLVHGWVAARVDREASWQLFLEALEADLSDTQGGTTREGVHLGAMAGTVDMMIRCYAGIETRADALWMHPRLPTELPGVFFQLRYRNQPITVRINHNEVTLELHPGSAKPITVNLEGNTKELAPGERWTMTLKG